jgi:hypothetical protein
MRFLLRMNFTFFASFRASGDVGSLRNADKSATGRLKSTVIADNCFSFCMDQRRKCGTATNQKLRNNV